ncbi:hypothetical protein [Treponema endosymbiont of Eucomonympha sp.]|nr:hypothetical protein [Treponema endosymbiont of Eucomonympha sp.]
MKAIKARAAAALGECLCAVVRVSTYRGYRAGLPKSESHKAGHKG